MDLISKIGNIQVIYFMREVESETPSMTASEASGQGPSIDSGLGQLREQIKSTMIPLLIKVFHLKLEAQQASSPPSRLQSKPTTLKTEEIVSQLEKLDEDLKLLQLWCQSCRNQVQKVLSEAQDDLSAPLSGQVHSSTETNPAVQRSFLEAMSSSKDSHPSPRPFQAKAKEHQDHTSSKESQPAASPKESWWSRILSD